MNLDVLSQLHWIRPEAFWGLLALPLIIGAAWLRGRRGEQWTQAVDPHLLPHVLAGAQARPRQWPWLLLLGWVIAITALAGPSWRQQAQPLLQTRDALVIALDLSTRTGATDLAPSRLLQARAKIAALLKARQGGQVALVVYAADAYTVAPLTDDVGNIALYLDALSPRVMPADGQRADRALDWSTELLQRTGLRQGRILLLTDRADADAVDAARRAEAQGMTVSVLGLGTTTGAAFRDGRGEIRNAALDAASLQRLARAGGGQYRPLATDDADVRALAKDGAEAGGQMQEGQQAQQWRDEGYWLLLPLMLLALLAFRRRAPLLAILLVFGTMPLASLQAQARPASAQATAPSTGGSWWRRADQLQQRRMEAGVQSYRAGDFDSAAAQFEGIDTHEGWYNLGNARARLGDLDGAVEAYDKALSRKPGMPDAVANRAVVDAARKRRPPPGTNDSPSQSQGGSGKGQGAGQGSDTGQGRSDTPSTGQAQGQTGAEEQPRGPSPGADGQKAGNAPAGAVDPGAQQAADARQRERMQQALERNADGGGSDEATEAPEGESARATTAAGAREREERQALEAWMRRVPDQPGDLLRAKFELEAKRRKREGR